jgi:hypothetical protein
MRRSAPHRVLAWFFDVILFSAIATNVTITFPGSSSPTSLLELVLSFAFFIAFLGIPIAYHRYWSDRVTFLTPGERFAGRWVVDGRKVWLNPYTKSRVFLFAIVAWTLFVNLPNASTAAGDSQIERIGSGVVVVACLVALGQGYSWAALGAAAYRLWFVFKHSPALADLTVGKFLATYTVSLLMAIVCLMTAYAYRSRGSLVGQ